jgi:hypothetical protein
MWDGGRRNEVVLHGIGSFHGTTSLGKATDFVSIGCLPMNSSDGLAEFFVFGKFTGVGIEALLCSAN